MTDFNFVAITYNPEKDICQVFLSGATLDIYLYCFNLYGGAQKQKFKKIADWDYL